MNKSIGIQLLVFSLLLACLSYASYQFAPTLARPTLIVGVTGGVLCFIWALRTLSGSRNKALPLLTLIPLAFALLSQTVSCWLGGGEVQGRLGASAVVTVAFFLSFAMLMRVAYAGVVFDGEQSTDNDPSSRAPGDRQPTSSLDRLRR